MLTCSLRLDVFLGWALFKDDQRALRNFDMTLLSAHMRSLIPLVITVNAAS